VSTLSGRCDTARLPGMRRTDLSADGTGRTLALEPSGPRVPGLRTECADGGRLLLRQQLTGVCRPLLFGRAVPWRQGVRIHRLAGYRSRSRRCGRRPCAVDRDGRTCSPSTWPPPRTVRSTRGTGCSVRAARPRTPGAGTWSATGLRPIWTGPAWAGTAWFRCVRSATRGTAGSGPTASTPARGPWRPSCCGGSAGSTGTWPDCPEPPAAACPPSAARTHSLNVSRVIPRSAATSFIVRCPAEAIHNATASARNSGVYIRPAM
jgi:hypothetical protein